MIVLGLTGSIGMGKSTVAAMMRILGLPVHDSDEAVHRLLRPKSQAWDGLLAAFPAREYPQVYERKTLKVNRQELGALVFADQVLRFRLEQVLHPLVRDSQENFLNHCRKKGTEIAVLEIPLLYETGAEKRVDFVLVVSAPRFIQRQRVLARPGMDEAKLQAILLRQMPDIEKRKRADYVIHTGLGRAQSMRELRTIIGNLRKKEERIGVETLTEEDQNPQTMRIQRYEMSR